jgi:hypothetical protein
MNAQVCNETLVRVAVNTLLDALARGEFAVAAREQDQLRELGWYISREAPRAIRHSTRQTTPSQGSGQ